MRLWICLLALFLPLLADAQTSVAYADADSIARWQQHYKEEFLHDARTPLRAGDTAFLRFYPYNSHHAYYAAKVRLTPEAKPFSMATHGGKTKRFRQYAIVKCVPHHGFLGLTPAFMRRGVFTVHLYQSLPASGDSATDDALFLPFYDRTNGTTTYGGGRYLDLHISDIRKGRINIDFNHAYNPWCAYKEGYNCPIPPKENRLAVRVEAGEMMYAGPHKD
jgi:hypothetical protein